MVVALPFLTRLYTPHDFEILAVYAGLLVILSGAACLRFDIAIPLPESNEDAANVLAIALVAATGTSIVISIPVLLFPDAIAGWLRQPGLAGYLWMLPIGVAMAASYSALQFWAMREKAFGAIARTRMSQAVGAIGIQTGLGWLGLAPFGLLLGQMISAGAGVVGLAGRVVAGDRSVFRSISTSKMLAMFHGYDRFPKFSTLEVLANTAGIQLPIILIAALAAGSEAGYLMLAMRVMQVPMGLIGGAVSQVYLSHASEEFRDGTLGSFTTKVLSGLVRAGVGPLIFAGILAPKVFSLVFGSEWQRAGELVSWMTPWFVMQFLASPISMVMHVVNKQPQMLTLTTIGLVSRLGIVIAFSYLSPALISESYAISGCIFYTVCLLTFCKASGIDFRCTKWSLINLYPVALWISLAISAALIMG